MKCEFTSVRVLCETVKAFVDKVSKSHDLGGEGEKDDDSGMGVQFDVLNEKLQSLLNTLHRESEESKVCELSY